MSLFGCGCYGEKDETDGKKGTPLAHDADFKGPIRGKARRPKDILCLILFVIFIIFMLAIAVFAWVNGEPERLIFPTDSKGRLCGVHEAVRDKPNLLFFDLTRCISVLSVDELLSGNAVSGIFTCPTTQVCVAECPSRNEIGVRSNPVCVDGVDTTEFQNITDALSLVSTRVVDLLDLIQQEKCAPYYIVSTEIANRCIPTGVNLIDQAQDVFNFSSPDDILTFLDSGMMSNVSFEDIFLTINVQDMIDGNFTQQVLVASRQFLLDVYQDFAVVWPALLIGLVVAMVLSFVYIILLRCLAGPIIAFGILLAFFLIFAVTVFSYYQFYCFQDASRIASEFNDFANGVAGDLSANATLSQFINTSVFFDVAAVICSSTDPLRDFIDSLLPWFEYQEYTWLAIGILGTLLFLILLILLIFLIKKIAISIAVIKEASKAVTGVPTSTIYPILTWTLLIVILVYWGAVALFLLTASTPTYAVIMNSTATVDLSSASVGEGNVTNGDICDPDVFNETIIVTDSMNAKVSVSCQFDQFVTSNFLFGLQIYHLFGLFWLTNFVLALGEVTLAGAFASWYWAFKKPRDVPTFALIQSFGRAILFHSGSIAFGALLIALVQLARVVLAYTQKKLKGKTGRVAQALLCLLQCCLWCFEKILRYINRQAYIEIAIYGYDFCTGACKAVKLLLRNILTTAVKDRIVAFLLFLGKLAITGVVGVLAYLGFSGFLDLGTSLWGRPLNYYLLPIMLLVIATYLISSAFMSVYHMAVDTVFICALEDLERNNGRDKPYFMSKRLMKLLNAKNEGTDGDETDGGEIQMESVETIKS